MKPKTRQLLDVVAPPPADSHAVYHVLEAKVFKYRLGELDGQDSKRVDSFGRREFAGQLVVELLK